MTNSNGKVNSSGRKKLIIAVCVVACLAVLLSAFLLLKNTVFFAIAESKAESQDFKTAQSYLEGIDSEKAKVLNEYVSLRIDINSHYALLLSSFDIDTVTEWKNAADEILSNEKYLSENLKATATELSSKLDTICSIYEEFSERKSDILELMDIFEEINRLYTKDDSGNNTSFTVSEEYDKIERWKSLYNTIFDYSSRIPNGDSIYLLSYLLKETLGEIDDLNSAMDKILSKGYSETDTVRVSGEGHKQYQSITNSNGITVNLARKEEYTEYLFTSICQALAKSLAEYYMGI
jgi:hypothetical protein